MKSLISFKAKEAKLTYIKNKQKQKSTGIKIWKANKIQFLVRLSLEVNRVRLDGHSFSSGQQYKEWGKFFSLNDISPILEGFKDNLNEYCLQFRSL
jgi:hypothetical protein